MYTIHNWHHLRYSTSSASGLLRSSWSHIRLRSFARHRKSTGRSICHTLNSSIGRRFSWACLRPRVPGWVLISWMLPWWGSRGWVSAGLVHLGGGGGRGTAPPESAGDIRWLCGGCSTSRVVSEAGVFRMVGRQGAVRVSMICSNSVGPTTHECYVIKRLT